MKKATAEQNEKNRIKSKVRAKVEHAFGQWVICLGGKFMRLIGKTRVQAAIGLKNLAYNFRRYGGSLCPIVCDFDPLLSLFSIISTAIYKTQSS